TIPYTAARFKPGDRLIFGSESKGLSDELLARHESHTLAVPMQVEHVRSLNLAMTVGIVLYEALRQAQE
ncbi:MAG: TrmH family RNA methyltransferase, partial [bacterium]